MSCRTEYNLVFLFATQTTYVMSKDSHSGKKYNFQLVLKQLFGFMHLKSTVLDLLLIDFVII